VAVAFVPFTWLPYGLAYFIWFVLDCFLLAAAMFSLERYLQLDGRRALAFRAVSLTFLPVFLTLGLGQVSIVLLALACGFFFAARAGRPEIAGILLAVASLKPFYVAPVLLVFLLRRCWRLLAAYLGTGLCLLAAPLPLFGPAIYSSYVELLRQVGSWQGRSINQPLTYRHVAIPTGTYAPQWNHGFAGFAELLLPGRLSTAVYLGCAAASLALVCWVALRSQSHEPASALAVVAGLLISPHTLLYDYTVLLLPVAIAARHRAPGDRSFWPVVGSGYVLVTLGYRFAWFIPVQLSVVASVMLMLWLATRALTGNGNGLRTGSVKTRPDTESALDSAAGTFSRFFMRGTAAAKQMVMPRRGSHSRATPWG
jgi:hypothetical protein